LKAPGEAHSAGPFGLCEAVFEIRNLVRSPAATRENGTIPAAQGHAKDELLRIKKEGAE
jgi:hypothetical protein